MEACCSRFTAAEGGARLAAAAGAQNTLAVEYAPFVTTRLLHEEAYKIRGLLSDGRHRSVFVCRASRVRPAAYELNILTDLAVTQAIQYQDVDDWRQELDVKEVLVCTTPILKRILEEHILTMENINVLILDSCHLIWKDVDMQYIMTSYKQFSEDKRPRILALTYPLFSSNKKDIDTTEKKEEIPATDTKKDKTVEENTKADDEGVKMEEIKEEEMGVCKNIDDFPTYEKLEWKIEELEKELCCRMDLAEDIDGGKRLSLTTTKPRELIIEYSGRPPAEALSQPYAHMEAFMRDEVNDALHFLHEHRHDPTEIYGDELYEEFMNIPDPKLDPKQMFNQFIYVLDQLGPYAADKAAFSLLIKLEKLKIKVPYERHFLLLCVCTTVFVKIRSYADYIFSQYSSDWEKIKTFSTSKVLRFAEILEQFQPPDMGQKIIRNREVRDNDNGKNTKIKMLNDIEQCDFASLGDRIEDKVNTMASNLKELDIETKNDTDSKKNEKDNHKNEVDNHKNEIDNHKNEVDNHKNELDSLKSNSLVQQRGVLGFPRRTGHRLRARGRVQRNNAARVQQMQMNPDALCGIVFMKEALMAKIMFMLIVDMSRCNPRLSYLCAQYCAVEPKSPELAECQRQGRKQEDVLKKFRMHECNLLLATSALEEGIDLPRCNLVLRWDVPPSYRSYGLCRGRARAPRAATALLCTDSPDTTDTVLHNVAIYRELDQMITRKCGCGVQNEPPPAEEEHADNFTSLVKPYTPNESKNDSDNRANDELDNHKNEKDNHENEEDNHKNEKDNHENREDSKNENDSLILNTENGEDTLEFLNAEVNGIKNENDTEFVNVYSHQNDEASHNFNNENEVSNDEFDSVKNENDNQLYLNDEVDNHKNDQDSQLPNDYSKDSSEITLNFDSNSDDRTQSVNSSLGNERCISKLNNDIPVKNEKDNKLNLVESNEHSISIETAKKYTQNQIENTFDSDKVSECKNDIDNECCEKNEIDNKDSSLDSKKVCDGVASVDLSTAIALINRYCGKLPSDTFTRLAPQWWLEEVQLPVQDGTKTAYICTLRLPLNCPVKYNIVGHPMPTKVLARRMVALQACRILHKSGELDHQLMPIGKENFKAADMDQTNYSGCGDYNVSDPNDTARPGTTKRRQYYFKRTAWAFTDCQPVVDTSDSEIDPPEGATRAPAQNQSPDNSDPVKEVKKGTKRNMLYAIVSKLWCALPERYNTRGRRLHQPQHATQAIGILMARNEPDSLQIPAFPVYTRSGEVRVSVEHVPDADVRVSPRRGRLVRRFMRFVFAEVLRVRRRGMKLQSEGSTHNNYYIVPTIKTTKEDGTSKIDIDWAFLELIYQHTEEKKHSELEKASLWHNDEEEQDVTSSKVEEDKKEKKKMENPLLKSEETFVFDAEKYREAVVTPWYRNQDQPQFFLVAEICWNLTPDSAFPSPTHTSFRHYYNNKYNVVLTQSNQPLLDVDHTSARLNLLTPRYVNRKGVALPVSSERTRRAKRDRLDQKQILVPELCRVHPFAAPLWFATVALPCVLYRINALLIADEIRRAVAIDVGLGIPKIDEKTYPGFQWPPLDFGWSLAEVLSADSEKTEKKKEEEDGEKKEKESKDKDESKSEKEKSDQQDKEEVKEKTINDILQEKEDAESGFEIGMWSNDMASSIPQSMEYDEFMEPLPPNLTFCTSASGGTNWCDPIEKPKSSYNPSRKFSMADSDCSYMSSDFDTDDSDLDSEGSDEDTDTSGFCSKNTYASMGVRIEYKTAHEAEAVDLERKHKVNPAPLCDVTDDHRDRVLAQQYVTAGEAPIQYIEKFRKSVAEHKRDIIEKGHLIKHNQPIKDLLPDSTKDNLNKDNSTKTINLEEIFPYNTDQLKIIDNQICLESIEKNKRKLLNDLKKSLSIDEIKKLNCFSMVDVDIDSPDYVNEKVVNVGFDSKSQYEEKIGKWDNVEFKPYYEDGRGQNGKEFDFDYQPELEGHPGPSPSVILQALTMSNANDGINLERLETIGDSFLKFAITAYLYCAHPTVHEGKLSHMRSKQVSNLNLYRLGRNKRLGARMIASKFEPHDNWLPPCHKPPHTLHPTHTPANTAYNRHTDSQENSQTSEPPPEGAGCFIPYNLITQHSIPDKSIADCVEALIGAYLLECGPRGALLFMSWLGIRVLPKHDLELDVHLPTHVHTPPHADTDLPLGNDAQKSPSPLPPKRPQASPSSSSCSSDDDDDDDDDEEAPQQESFPDASWTWRGRPVGSLRPYRDARGRWIQQIFGELKAPPSPLLRYIADPEGELEQMLSGYEALEATLQYRFRDRSLLLQALTHASHHRNRLTDCYQRLEFLGDAILDYLITRHLYCDPRRHSPGALTDLRSALVNNTIFATLAARHGFHKYFRHMSPGLNEVLTKYVKIQEENGHSISEEHYLIQEDEMEQAEDVEVPKALGDLFESVAGAIFLDSGMSLGAVWKSYVNLMGAELEAFSAAAPKSPVRELLEAEPDTAKFGKPERLADGRRVRVCVEVFGRGQFKGVGRNYRIAKGTAARCALRHLKGHRGHTHPRDA